MVECVVVQCEFPKRSAMAPDKRTNNSNIMLLVLSISTPYDRVFTSTPLKFYAFLVCFAVSLHCSVEQKSFIWLHCLFSQEFADTFHDAIQPLRMPLHSVVVHVEISSFL